MQSLRKEYEPGEIIVRRGGPDHALLVLAQGQVRVIAPSDEDSGKAIRLIQRGETFGEVAALDGGPRRATVVSDCCHRAIPANGKRLAVDPRVKGVERPNRKRVSLGTNSE